MRIVRGCLLSRHCMAVFFVCGVAANTMANAADKPRLEEIVVRGDKVERSLQETVSSVGVMTGDEIQRAGITEIQQAFERIANVNQRFGGEGFSVRGINNATVAGGGRSGLASFYLDGAFLSGFAIRVGPLELWDAAQVEVFRGPQSTSQGRNSLAGIVSVQTRAPTYHWEARARWREADYDSHARSVALGGPLWAEQMAFRVSYDDQYSRGYIENPTLNDPAYGESSNRAARARLLWEPIFLPALSVLLTYGDYDNASGDDVVDGREPYERVVFSNVRGFEDNRLHIASVELDYELGERWWLKYVGSNNQGRYLRQDDDDQSADGGPAFRARENVASVETHELRFHFRGDRLSGHLGVYQFRESVEDFSPFLSSQSVTLITGALGTGAFEDSLGVDLGSTAENTLPPALFIRRDLFFTQTTRNIAVFAEFSYELNDFVTVFGGVRRDTEEQDDFLLSEVFAVTQPPGQGEDSRTDVLVQRESNAPQARFDATLPKLGFTLNWSDALNSSFSVSRGYRAGGGGVAPTSGPYNYDPEFVTNYELALRSRWLDDTLSVNANVFYIDWTDQQVLQRDPEDAGAFLVVNAGESVLKGLELEMQYLFSERLRIATALGYVRTEFKEFETAQGDFSDNEFPNAPRFNVSLSVSYEHPSGVFSHLNVNRLDDNFEDPANTAALKNDERTLSSLRTGYKATRWTLALYADNLFDEDYLSFVSPRNGVVKVGAPRVVGGELTIHFD